MVYTAPQNAVLARPDATVLLVPVLPGGPLPSVHELGQGRWFAWRWVGVAGDEVLLVVRAPVCVVLLARRSRERTRYQGVLVH